MAKTLIGLGDDDCRYPLTPLTFCGAPRLRPHSYCGHHLRICYTAGTGSNRARSPLSIPHDPVKPGEENVVFTDALVAEGYTDNLPPAEPVPDLVEAMVGDEE